MVGIVLSVKISSIAEGVETAAQLAFLKAKGCDEIQGYYISPPITPMAMAALLRDDLLELGFVEAELVPTDGHPGVWGYYDAGAEKTLVVYLMYDVQPVEPDDWQSPPFAAELVDHELGTVLMGRGATNQKGPQRAFLNAVQSIIATEGRLPVNLMVAAEGEEELGSPHYPQVIDRYEERLQHAVGAIFPFNSQRPDGALSMILGVKGIVYFELEARGGPHGLGDHDRQPGGEAGHALDAVDVGQRAFATRGRLVARVVGKHAGCAVELADVHHIGPAGPLQDRQLVIAAADRQFRLVRQIASPVRSVPQAGSTA